ncbi:MAG: peptidase domain-containing ABC transporter [Cyanobacteria bacterium SBLK]|nr:peptidase domain-containing ABC transporter [Cyanobacteria bacterium SBLK]
MVSGKSSGAESQNRGRIAREKPPFCWCDRQQQNRIETRLDIREYTIGEKIWESGVSSEEKRDREIYLLVSGKVRLRREAPPQPLFTLQEGDWFGDLLALGEDCKAVASGEVTVWCWKIELWQNKSTELQDFWQATTARYLGETSPEPPLDNLPVVAQPRPIVRQPPPEIEETVTPEVEDAKDASTIVKALKGVLWEGSEVEAGEILERVQEILRDRPLTPLEPAQTKQPRLIQQDISPYSKYPFISSKNSAAACLSMVAQYFNAPAALEWTQRQLRGDRPHHLVDGGEKLGLQLRGLKVRWGDLPRLSTPLLLQWQPPYVKSDRRFDIRHKVFWAGRKQLQPSDPSRSQRWIVLYEIKGGKAIIGDPLNPRLCCEPISRKQLIEGWKGRVWQVEPIRKQETFNLSWFLPSVWRYRGLLQEVLLASFTLQLLGLGTPIITQVIIDKVMVQESLATLDVMAIAMLSIAGFESVLGILRLYIFTHTARRLDLALSGQVFRHLMRLPLAYFESRRVGDTVARVQELENIRQFLTGTALTVVLDSIFAVVYLALMFYYSVQLTWVALAILPLFALLTLLSTPILRHWLNETFNRNADSQSFLVETITGIRAVKAHAAEGKARDRWEGLFARYIRTGFRASTTSNISNNIGSFFTNLSTLLILWFGAKLVINREPGSEFTIGMLIAFQMLSGRVTAPLLRLVQLWQNLQQVLLSVDRIGDILNVAPEAEPGSGLVLPKLRGQVVFDRVFFRYKEEQEPIIRGISFTVQPGMFVGIVGRSGSGKSTLSKLLQRLYNVESGRILLDGFDVKSADLASLRQQINVVLQDDFLFNASILENITFGHPDISAEQVVEAARKAAAHDFISELPHGYETNVGERGTALSGGQKQRITLARLFLSQAPIVILDEATSALDAETEQQVLTNLQEFAKNRTVFAIAHRFDILRDADLILVMEKGVLIEKGKHEDLLKMKGLYFSLYERQKNYE